MTIELPSADEISELVEQVVATLDGLEARPCPPSTLDEREPSWTACVSLGGGFEGAVTLQCSERLAQRIAGAMLATPPEELTDEAAQDAFGELAHVVAGNIKSLIGPPSEHVCSLLGRKVVAGLVGVPDAAMRREACFDCAAQRFAVKLWESQPTREPRAIA